MMLPQLIPQLIFFAFAGVLIGAALMTVIARSPVRSALFLILAFFASAALWILLTVEFLGLILILVYVGAVMTLFLFVVMTLNIRYETADAGLMRYLPYLIVIVAALVLLLLYAINAQHFTSEQMLNSPPQSADYSNIKTLGSVLYTDYVYPFELAGVILLVAIIAAIQRADRIRLVKMPTEKK
jgi:NADH-quinone oxidoreductase subunit J